MAKMLCWIGIVISLLIFVLFVLDISIGMPFSRASVLFDIVFIAVAVCMVFLGWTTLRSLK